MAKKSTIRTLEVVEIVGDPREDIPFTVTCLHDDSDGERWFRVEQTGAEEALYDWHMSAMQAIQLVSFMRKCLGIKDDVKRRARRRHAKLMRFSR